MTAEATLRRALVAAIEASGWTHRELAAATDRSTRSIGNIARGLTTPTHGFVVALSDALGGSDALVALSVRWRTRVCGICEASFVDLHPQRRSATCGTRCATTANARRMRARYAEDAQRTLDKGLVARRRLTVYQESVAAHCRACAPEGMCWDAACRLRPVSPLRLEKGARAA